MRVSIRAMTVLLLWALALWPAALELLLLDSPVTAVAWDLRLREAARWTAVALAVAVAAAALLYPPFLPGLRLQGQRLRLSMSGDRTRLRNLQFELRQLETAARQLEAGRLALGMGDARTALPHLLRAVELDPEHLPARWQLGLALKQLGQLQLAAAELGAVVARDPVHAFGQARLAYGAVLHAMGRDAEAAAELRAREAAHGPSPEASFVLGRALLATGDREGARSAFSAAVACGAGAKLDAQQAWYRARARAALRRLGR